MTDNNTQNANSHIQDWFGEHFRQLHPLLQALHTHGGSLAGPLQLDFGTGLAGIIGKRIAKKLGVPVDAAPHQIKVFILHQADGMHWDRCFDDSTLFKSLFVPTGNIDDGYWQESSGRITLYLTVDIIDRGWHWRCLKIKWKRISLPCWLLPRTDAYKRIEQDKYRFQVSFSLPLLGRLFSYGGLLDAHLDTT